MTTNALVKVNSKYFLPLRPAIISFNMCTCAYISLIATDRDIETKPNEVYGLVSGQTTGHRDCEFYE